MESYVTPILLSYVDKYVRDFNPADVQVSLWGGGVTLHNLVLRPDVLQREVSLPFTLVSGRIHELLISVPWTRITYEPIEVAINTIECVLSLNPPNPADDNGQFQAGNQVVPSPPRYMRGLIRRVVSNITVTIQSLIVKYVHDDIVVSLNIKWIHIDSADAEWKPAFVDIDANNPVVRRLVRVDDFTLCLDHSDWDGRIRHYQEPLLDRCQLEIRILTTLMSLKNRNAKNITVQIRSENLELSVSSDQLILLLRLLREQPTPGPAPAPAPAPAPVPGPAPAPAPGPRSFTTATNPAPAPVAVASSSTEVTRVETWSDWAWSWFPSWSDRNGVGEGPAPARPFPVLISAFIDKLTVVYKLMETELSTGRRYARPLMELAAAHVAVTYLARAPTLIRLRAGARALQLISRGKCVCGHTEFNSLTDNQTPFLVTDNTMESNYFWPEEMLRSYTVEPELQAEENGQAEFPDLLDFNEEEANKESEIEGASCVQEDLLDPELEVEHKRNKDLTWFKMSPAIYFQCAHDRHPSENICPYEDPPQNFEYSDWQEDQRIFVRLRPIKIYVCSGLIHRLETLPELLQELPPVPGSDMVIRPLTVEECEALTDNIPKRHIDVKAKRLEVLFNAWDHGVAEQPAGPAATLELLMHWIQMEANGPLYPKRVCLAAREIEDFENPIREATYMQIKANIISIEVRLSTPNYRLERPIFNTTVFLNFSILLYKHVFKDRRNLFVHVDISIPMSTMFTTLPTVYTVVELLTSLYRKRPSAMLKDTTLVDDVTKDQDTVGTDCEFRNVNIIFYRADNVKMGVFVASAVKMSAVELKNGKEGSIGWIFSAAEHVMYRLPCLLLRVQLCDDRTRDDALEYVAIQMDTYAINLEPLLLRWLNYQPHLRPRPKSLSKTSSGKLVSSSKYFTRRRGTPPASTARGSRAGSAAELVHGRTRSAESVGERSGPSGGQRSAATKAQEKLWDSDKLLSLYHRLRRTLISVDMGKLLVYSSSTTASSVGCGTIRDAVNAEIAGGSTAFVFSLGKWELTTAAENLWEYVNERIPTYLPPRMRLEQTFPWKVNISDMSSFTLQKNPHSNKKGCEAVQRVLLHQLGSTVTISIITKTADNGPIPQPKPKRSPPPTRNDQKRRYFTAGIDYRPTTLKEYFRGPRRRPGSPEPHAGPEPPEPPPDRPARVDGPLVSLGVHVHCDTPPLTVHLIDDQIHLICPAFHYLSHIVELLRRLNTPIALPKSRSDRPSSAPLLRSGADLRSSSEGTPSENISEQLIPIYQTRTAQDISRQLKTNIWFQWVVNRASVSLLTSLMKLSLEVEDSMATVNLEETYEQFRLKIGSCSVYHFNTNVDAGSGWVPGVFGGRVLETREALDRKTVNFFACVGTRVHISNLPTSWKEEFAPKALRTNQKREGMWEINVRTAPVEVMLHPQVLEAFTVVRNMLTLSSSCPEPFEKTTIPMAMPICHFNLGAVRLVVTNGEYDGVQDDTLIFYIGNITTRPNPQNPICRRSISALGEAGWVPVPNGGCDGRQHELVVKGVGVRSARIREILAQMKAIRSRSERTVNPAANWAEPLPAVHMTPILHYLDVQGVIAPPLYSGEVLACGPALELNVPADVTVELSAEQVALLARVLTALQRAWTNPEDWTLNILSAPTRCPMSSRPVYNYDLDEDELLLDEAAAGVSDSGVESQPSNSHVDPLSQPKAALSGPSLAQTMSPWEHVEVFMMMGRIDFAFYVRDDPQSSVISSLRPSDVIPKAQAKEETDEERANVTVVINTGEEKNGKDLEPESVAASKSLTETAREADVGRSRLEIFEEVNLARRFSKFIPILHATLSQPNMYYWRKMSVKGLQMSLFNLWVAHGEGQDDASWHMPLLNTREGERDPDTEIPPSLASVHFDTLPSASCTDATRDTWSVQIDVDRPVSIDLHPESLRRLKIIAVLISCAITGDTKLQTLPKSETPVISLLHSLAVSKGIEHVTVRTCQMALQTVGVSVGWEALTAQLSCGRRPERLCMRTLLTALTVTTHAPHEPPKRHVAVPPLTIGVQAEAAWESWRTGKPVTSCKPSVRVSVELSDLAVDVRPCDIGVLKTALQNINDLAIEDLIEVHAANKNSIDSNGGETSEKDSKETSVKDNKATSSPPHFNNGAGDVYYKDDLRSGAFKIICGEQTRAPMAYEVALRGSTVMWHYPVPRCIVRLVAYPIPDCDEEVDCVLESWNQLLDRWEMNANFKVPVSESREYQLTKMHSDKVFAKMWRVRLMPSDDKSPKLFKFNREKYLPQDIPVVQFGACAEESENSCADEGGLSAEQLAGALRVDSYMSVRLTPHLHVAVKCGSLAVHAHNDLPPDEPAPDLGSFLPQLSHWEGIYVSAGNRRAHRVLTTTARGAVFNVMESVSYKMLSFESLVGVDLFESETGTMEPLVRDFKLQAVLCGAKTLRARLCAGDIRVYVNGPRVRTLTAMVNDWRRVYDEYVKPEPQVTTDAFWLSQHELPPELNSPGEESFNLDRRRLENACRALEGRVYLYVVNTCDVPLRIGQEGTDEVIPLMSNTTLAYRWNSSLAPKKLRFSSMSVNADWHWSNSISFTEGTHKVRLEAAGETGTSYSRQNATFLYLRVEDLGGWKIMYLSGKVLLGNMLKDKLSYKMRIRDPTTDSPDGMRTLSRGELIPESVGLTVLDAVSTTDTYMKIKFASQETGWTGDIPLKPCPKSHVPWLVKVPLTTGEVPCVSVWCRVERTRKDDRVSVLFFPMFLMRSHLPLDINVSMTTEQMELDSEDEQSMPPLTQRAAGRGSITQLLVHGTTTVKHTLIFRYRIADCQVTRDSVPLHYGMVEKSVFEQYSPPAYTDDIAADALRWLSNDIGENTWPYSVVRTHWPYPWKAAALQPRCDVLVRYAAVVCGGSGCGMLVHLMPCALLANATDVIITVRASDAAPFCRIDPGVVIALPAPIVEKPFFVTLQERHETYMSNELSVCHREPGVYGTLSTGQLAPDRPTHFAVHCNDRVALMTIHYNIYKEINVFGVTSTYMFKNKLPFDILIAPMAIQYTPHKPPILRPDVYIRIRPALDESSFGVRITHFWLGGPWSDDVDNIRAFMCFGIPANDVDADPVQAAVPVQVGVSAMRRSIALRNHLNESIPAVVTQVYHEGRWLVTLAADPCPQYLVRNLTREPLVLALPQRAACDPRNDELPVMVEYTACKWWFVLEPQQYSYYSTPTHLATDAPLASGPNNLPAALLVAGRIRGELTPEWGNPFAVKEGEQLVQLSRDLNLKVRVNVHPHSTVIDLVTVDEGDLSASEIRRRLAHRFTLPDIDYPQLLDRMLSDNKYSEELKEAHRYKLEERELSNATTGSNTKTQTETADMKPDQMAEKEEQAPEPTSTVTLAQLDCDSDTSQPLIDSVPNMSGAATLRDLVRCAADSVSVELAHGCTHTPLVRASAERVKLLLRTDGKNLLTMVSVGEVQVDNPQHASRQFDFAVVASTSAAPPSPERFPPLWGTLVADQYFVGVPRASNLIVRTMHVKWTVAGVGYGQLTQPTELTELFDVDIYVGPISLYIEDVYVQRVSALAQLLSPPPDATAGQHAAAEALALYKPLRVHHLYVHPLDLTLTLHTAMRLYIGVDKSPLRMSAFKLENVVTTSDRLTHELTVHYLSGAILGAGWVVGGLELLGAPGSLAARLSSARGGVRDVATTAGAAVLRSLNSCAGSLARNLDLLAGDDEHTQRAAIARREIPPTLLAGLFAGMQNFAVNILGAVGGLAHHPVVGLAEGETSGAAALRRGLVGALAKPLSATADLVAFAGQGLLSQTGWDPDPQQRAAPPAIVPAPWRRDNVRWTFRLQSLRVLHGVDAALDGTTVRLVVTDKFLVVAEPNTERIVEMVDFRFCKLVSYDAQDVELRVTQNGPRSDTRESGVDETAYRVNSAAMARVARYTGARAVCEGRALRLHTSHGGPALAAAIIVAVRQNQPTHFSFL